LSYELVLSFRGRKVETEDEIVEIEDALFELLENGETWDGHDMRAAARNVSVVTPDAQATFARIAPFLAAAGLIDHVTVAARPLAGDIFVTLWPRSGEPFDRG
jgi:hypothetical protein